MSVQQSFLDSMEIVSKSMLQKAGYDRTVQAQILSCVDESIGKYKCRYQDAIIYAYSNNIDLTYTKNSYVYIHIPNGDLSKDKTILGTTEKLGVNFIAQVPEQEKYDMIGGNTVREDYQSAVYFLDTNSNYNYEISNTTIKKEKYLDGIIINNPLLQKNLKKATSIIISLKITTNIEEGKRFNGHYGVIFNLSFKDASTGESVIRSYAINEDSISGDPYNLSGQKQTKVFQIDGENFQRVQSINFYNADFPANDGETITKELKTPGDIIISELEIASAVRLTEEEFNGVSIKLYCNEGTDFLKNDNGNKEKAYRAEVRIKGKVAASYENIPFYWGLENASVISSNDKKYNKYLGRGYQCLNNYKEVEVTKKDKEDKTKGIEWIPEKNYFILKKDDVPSQADLKVAIVYQNTIITKTLKIHNWSKGQVTIESSEGQQFYFDNGATVLTCKVKIDGKQVSGNYTYSWAYSDKNKNLQSIAIDKKHPEQVTININEITTNRVVKCSVFEKNKEGISSIVGTGSITLTNTRKTEGTYSLIINNGSAVYQYDQDGNIASKKTLQGIQQIYPLSFTLYDNAGKQVQLLNKDGLIKSDCSILWLIPKNNTLLTYDKTDNTSNAYYHVRNQSVLTYGIADRYDIKKQNNQIILRVTYKGLRISAKTNFTFIKQGDPGTNGTDYTVRIVLNTDMQNPPSRPMLFARPEKVNGKRVDKFYLNYKIKNEDHSELKLKFNNTEYTYYQIDPRVNHRFFAVQVWRGGRLIWNNEDEKTTLDNIPPGSKLEKASSVAKVEWEILKNKYNKTDTDVSAFEYRNWTEEQKKFLDNLKKAQFHLLLDSREDVNSSRLTSSNLNPSLITNASLANLIKCTVTLKGNDNIKCFDVMPFITGRMEGNHLLQLKENTGFQYVLYSSSGKNPKYDNTFPFTFLFDKSEKINLNEKKTIGGIYGKPNSSNISIDTRNTKENEVTVLPTIKYNGECVNNALVCVCSKCIIHIPIYLYLNRYGISQLNDWDGNSIELNNNGGYILAPQMGAGKKDSSNAFTGVLMGEVKTSKNQSQTGLFGFNSGIRSIFLDSETGSAIFGKAGDGQIIIDPASEKGLIYGGNFWAADNFKDSGLLKDYTYRDKNYEPSNKTAKKGMIINLTDAQIYFGTGNFYVTPKGYIYAKGGGNIAGWNISDDGLTSTNKEGRLFLKSNGVIYSGSHDGFTNSKEGFHLSQNGLSIGAGVKITSTGKTFLGPDAAKDPKERKYVWTIDGDKNKNAYIKYGVKEKSGSVYLGTDGIYLGQAFSVDNEGNLTANSGTIGGWTITKNNLKAENVTLDSSGSITLGLDSKKNPVLTLSGDGSITGPNWDITSSGFANFQKVTSLTFVNGTTGSQVNFDGGAVSLNGGNWDFPTLASDGSGGTTLTGALQGLKLASAVFPTDTKFGTQTIGELVADKVSANTGDFKNLFAKNNWSQTIYPGTIQMKSLSDIWVGGKYALYDTGWITILYDVKIEKGKITDYKTMQRKFVYIQ